MQDIAYMQAESDDAEEIKRFLAQVKLPTEGIAPHIKHFILAKSQGGLAGTIGLETYEKAAVLRSFAVFDECRGHGLGTELYEKALDYARSLGLSDLYLLTTTAEGFFAKRGWTKIERKNTPFAIRASIEFKGACPVSAVCMKLSLRA